MHMFQAETTTTNCTYVIHTCEGSVSSVSAGVSPPACRFTAWPGGGWGGGQEGFCVVTFATSITLTISILLTRVTHVHQTSSSLLSFVGLLFAL